MFRVRSLTCARAQPVEPKKGAPSRPLDPDDLAERAAIIADMCDRLPDPGTPERARLDEEQARMVAGLLAAARIEATSPSCDERNRQASAGPSAHTSQCGGRQRGICLGNHNPKVHHHGE